MKTEGLLFSFSASVVMHGAVVGALMLAGGGEERQDSVTPDGFTLTIVAEPVEPEKEAPRREDAVVDLPDPKLPEPTPVQVEPLPPTPMASFESEAPRDPPRSVRPSPSSPPTIPSLAGINRSEAALTFAKASADLARSEIETITISPESGGAGAARSYQRPAYRNNPSPAYPFKARQRRQQGEVLVGVRVSAEGKAAHVWVKQSCGFTLLDNAALEAVAAWEFEPARIGHTRVESEIEVPVRFRLKD